MMSTGTSVEKAMMEKYDAGTVGGMVCRIVDQGRIGLSTVY